MKHEILQYVILILLSVSYEVPFPNDRGCDYHIPWVVCAYQKALLYVPMMLVSIVFQVRRLAVFHNER